MKKILCLFMVLFSISNAKASNGINPDSDDVLNKNMETLLKAFINKDFFDSILDKTPEGEIADQTKTISFCGLNMFKIEYKNGQGKIVDFEEEEENFEKN